VLLNYTASSNFCHNAVITSNKYNNLVKKITKNGVKIMKYLLIIACGLFSFAANSESNFILNPMSPIHPITLYGFNGKKRQQEPDQVKACNPLGNLNQQSVFKLLELPQDGKNYELTIELCTTDKKCQGHFVTEFDYEDINTNLIKISADKITDLICEQESQDLNNLSITLYEKMEQNKENVLISNSVTSLNELLSQKIEKIQLNSSTTLQIEIRETHKQSE
jgi:hypothetical protein